MSGLVLVQPSFYTGHVRTPLVKCWTDFGHLRYVAGHIYKCPGLVPAQPRFFTGHHRLIHGQYLKMSRTGNGKLLVSGNGISMVSDTGPFTTFTLDIGRTGVGPRGPEAPDTNIGPTLDQNSCTVRVSCSEFILNFCKI